jgi:hypothetical protein
MLHVTTLRIIAMRHDVHGRSVIMRILLEELDVGICCVRFAGGSVEGLVSVLKGGVK